MRLLLLILLLTGVSWVGNEFGFIANHYAHLESGYLQGLASADKAVANMKEGRDQCVKLTIERPLSRRGL